MGRKPKQKSRSSVARGPLARKVISLTQLQLQKKVTELADWKEARVRAEDFQKSVVSANELADYDPAHALYIYAQNQLSVLIEQIADLPMLEKLSDMYAEAQEEYMPSGPPMSPLTTSYFSCWGYFDLSSFGAKKETLATIAIDFCKFLQVDEGLISLYESLQASRMGIYKNIGISGKFVYLQEYITQREIKAISPAGYFGHPGELWYARVLPPPFDGEMCDYSVMFTTPYLLGKYGSSIELIRAVENDWLAYFDRTLPKTNIDDKVLAYEQLMKYGLSRNYWNEYVFCAYRNHQSNVIFLQGFPDIPSSMPHS